MKGKDPEIDTEEYQLCDTYYADLLGLLQEKKDSPKKTLGHFHFQNNSRILFVCFSKFDNMQAFSQFDSTTTFVQIK